MLEITKSNFKTEVTESDVPVVLDFWAPWCGPCRSIAPVLDKLSAEYGDRVKIAKVNIDNEPDLASAFGVQSIPMIVGMVKGEVKDVSMGFRGEQPLKKLIDGLM